MSDSLLSPPRLVGRESELTQLTAVLGIGLGAPAGAAVLLGGDAGVGKTRLAAELQERALGAGWQVLVGHCLDFGGDSLPYLPFTEIFGRLAAASPEFGATLLETSPALARLLPGRPASAAGEARPAAGAESRSELFEAISEAAVRATGRSPVLLVVEDLHWADSSTRELLTYLFTRGATPGLAILTTYRSDDLHRRHPLRADVAAWTRLGGVSRLNLQPLADEAVRDLVLSLHPDGLASGDVDRIVARAEGNAFFTEELVAAAGRGEQVLSADLADLLLLNLDQLDDRAREVLRAVSVAGRRIAHPLLVRVLGGDGPDLDAALRAAIDRNILVATREGSYEFRHALLAEAVYDDLLPGERVRWHRTYADVLGSGVADSTAAELARHARAAYDLPTAIEASVRAGADAMAVGGPAEAARHYELALEMMGEQAAGDADDRSAVIAVTLKAAEASVAAGLLHRAQGLVREQLAALSPDADLHTRILLLNAVATTALLEDSEDDALEHTTEALRLLPATERGALRAQLLAVHARANVSRNREDEAARWAREAIDLAAELHLPVVLADATTTLARLLRYGTAAQAEQALRASMAEARVAGDAAAEMRSGHHLGSLLFEAGRLSEAEQAYRHAVERAAALHRPWAPWGLDARALCAIVSYTLGDWEGAQALLDTTDESPPPLARSVLDAIGLSLAAGRGDTERGLTELARLRSFWDRDGMMAINCAMAAIDLYGDAGDVAGAVALHDDAVDLLARLWSHRMFQGRIRLAALLIGQLAGAAGSAGGVQRGELARLGDELHRTAREVAANAAKRGPESDIWIRRVDAEHLRLRWLTGDGEVDRGELVEAWRASVQAFENFGHVFETARSRARMAAVTRATGGSAEEVALTLERAVVVATALGARPLLRELAALGANTPPVEGSPAPPEDVLTPREHEVLGLVAQGRSNREIGQVLYISPKTVSVHVSNVLAKLHASGRTEAVALARRSGLL